MGKVITYRVWVGDEIKINTTNKEKALEEYNNIPSGKGKAPSKRRTLEKVETLKDDSND